MNNKLVKLEQAFAKYEIPQYVEKVDKQKNWVSYGVDNLFPNYLVSLIAKSARHASILKKKASLIGGRGFLTTNLQTETMMFLSNSKNEDDMEEILLKIAYDLELCGGFALNLIWSKDRTRISEINYIDVTKLRVCPPDPEKGFPQIEDYWISPDWDKYKKLENTPVLYPGFSTINRKQASQILYVKGNKAGSGFYAQPDYLPAIYWMELEFKISEFHLASLVNGFHPSFHINWPLGNNLSDEEMDEYVIKLKSQFGNSINAGESFISFSEDENKPTITPIQANSSDERFIQLDEIVEKGILAAHRVNNPALFGVSESGKLGDNNGVDRTQSMMEFEIDYVIPQQQIIEKIINQIARINGITDRIMINRYSDSYKKVGGDSIQDVISILESQGMTPVQKYHLLVSLNYTHDLSSKLSGYTEGNNLKSKPAAPAPQSAASVIKQHKFAPDDFDEVHPNCRCQIIDGVFECEDDACDECQAAADEYNNK